MSDSSSFSGPKERLLPNEVVSKSFGIARRGFKPEEVNRYLALLATYIAEQHKLFDALLLEKRDLEDRYKVAMANQGVAPKLDISAVTAALGEEAGEILRSATAAAESIKARANAYAEDLRKRAEDDISKSNDSHRDELAKRLKEHEATIDRLTRDANVKITAEVQRAEETARELVADAQNEAAQMIAKAKAVRGEVYEEIRGRTQDAKTELLELEEHKELVVSLLSQAALSIQSLTSLMNGETGSINDPYLVARPDPQGPTVQPEGVPVVALSETNDSPATNWRRTKDQAFRDSLYTMAGASSDPEGEPSEAENVTLNSSTINDSDFADLGARSVDGGRNDGRGAHFVDREVSSVEIAISDQDEMRAKLGQERSISEPRVSGPSRGRTSSAGFQSPPRRRVVDEQDTTEARDRGSYDFADDFETEIVIIRDSVRTSDSRNRGNARDDRAPGLQSLSNEDALYPSTSYVDSNLDLETADQERSTLDGKRFEAQVVPLPQSLGVLGRSLDDVDSANATVAKIIERSTLGEIDELQSSQREGFDGDLAKDRVSDKSKKRDHTTVEDIFARLLVDDPEESSTSRVRDGSLSKPDLNTTINRKSDLQRPHSLGDSGSLGVKPAQIVEDEGKVAGVKVKEPHPTLVSETPQGTNELLDDISDKELSHGDSKDAHSRIDGFIAVESVLDDKTEGLLSDPKIHLSVVFHELYRDAFAPIQTQIARRIKRVLQDDQNELLDKLRTSSLRTAEDLVGKLDHLTSRYFEVLGSFVMPVMNESRDFYSLIAERLTGDRNSIAILTEPSDEMYIIARDLSRELAEELIGRIERVLAKSDLDEDMALASQFGAAFRELKIDYVEALTSDLVSIYVSTWLLTHTNVSKVRWIKSIRPGCSDCEDNELEGPIDVGANFPTGTNAPPAHIGCECLLVPEFA